MEYIITDEGGTHYKVDEITQDEKDAAEDGILSIIRLSDGMQYGEGDKWVDLQVWGDW